MPPPSHALGLSRSDGSDGVQTLHDSASTRVVRLTDASGAGSIVRKEYLGPRALPRLRNERKMLTRLAGLEGVVQLAAGAREAQGAEVLTLCDCGGSRLEQWLQASPCDLGKVLSLAQQLARILAGIHRAGVIHRDINPTNILVTAAGQAMLIDFDLAMLAHQPAMQQQPQKEPQEHEKEDEQIVGTLSYMAPEQTGRTGRAVDQRADLYALGAVLYEMAAGQPAFEQADALQLIHDHLVREPVPPCRIDARVPRGLSDIILRLLAKAPEQRYQSAEGLLHDLDRLRAGLERGDDGIFALGERDFAARLAAPTHLVGRDVELATLRDAFVGAMQSERRTVLISGPAGIGKSVLINELRPVVAQAGGWFVYGKFDQYQKDGSATGGLTQALRALGGILLTQSAEAVATQRQRILHRLGPNAGVITRAAPEFSLLLGIRPDVPEVDPRLAELQLQQATLDLLLAIASPQCPLVLVVDDLQWASARSLRLFERMMVEPQLRGMLLVGAYRSEEVGDDHVLTPMLARWQAHAQSPTEVPLANLTVVRVSEMVREMLRLEPAPSRELAEALNVLTSGNPFDTVEMLNALRGEGVLTLGESGWQWDEVKVRHFIGRGNVVDLLAARICRLPASSREILEFMSCLGGAIEIELLSCAVGQSASDLRIQLLAPLEDGLVVEDQAGGQDTVRFRHDRVQQALLSVMNDSQRGLRQLAMARRLASQRTFERETAEQYLACAWMLDDPHEQRRVMDLFFEHAKVLAGRATYSLAERYLQVADGLLAGLDDPGDAALHRAIDVARHCALYSLGRVDEADPLYARIQARTQSPLDLIGPTCLQMRSLDMRGRSKEALALAVDLVSSLGLAVPPDFHDPQREQRLDGLAGWLSQESQSDPTQLPRTRDPRLLGIYKLLPLMFGSAYNAQDLEARAWVMLQAQSLWAEHGPAEALMACVASLGTVLISLRQDYRAAYDIARHVIAVGQALHFEVRTAATQFVFAIGMCPWAEPLENALDHATQAFAAFQAIGDDASYACYLNIPRYVYLCETGAALEACDAEIETGLLLCRRTGNAHATALHRLEQQFVRALRGLTRGLDSLDDSEFDEQAFMARVGRLPHMRPAWIDYRMFLSAMLGDLSEFTGYSPAALPHEHRRDPGLYRTMYGYFFAALARAWKLQKEGDAAASEMEALVAELDSCRSWLARRADDQPYNFLHLLRLVEAEQAWALGDLWKAAATFDAAVLEAESRQRPWHRALIAERAGRFHLAQGMCGTGQQLLAKARDHYQAWGAAAKVEQMQREHAFLRAPARSVASQLGSTAGHPLKTTGTVSPDVLDLVGVLRASQALSSETSLERLAARVIEVLASLSGATKVMVLSYNEEQWWLLPHGPQLPSMPVAQAAQLGLLPLSAFAYAERTRETLVVDDAAADNRFARDPYFASVPVCSLLLVPIASGGLARGMLLLENQLGRAAFNAQRLDAVMLIAGQLAVSLANAQLYKGPAVNQNATNARTPLVVRPEIPTMVEAGLKNMFLQGRVGVNVSAYATKVKDFQAQVFDPAAGAFVFSNAPEVKSHGVTLNVYGKPTQALTMNGGAAYMVSKLGAGFLVPCATGSAATCTRDANGEQVNGTPKLRATLAADYAFLLASFRAFVGGDVVYTSEKVFDRTDPARNLPATTIFGARFGLRTADDKLGLTLYARNLFDKFNPAYRAGNVGSFATGDTRSYIQFLVPESRRVLGLSLDAKF